MIPASSLSTQAADWRLQWREAVTDPQQLLAMLGLDRLADQVRAVPRQHFGLRVPRSFVGRMRAGDAADPLLRQVLPLRDELIQAPGFGLDAVGDLPSLAGTGVLHKYQGRALLIATGSCAIHCRYCFRQHFPYSEQTAARDRWKPAIEQLRGDQGISEVLLSGGDPLTLATPRLRELTDQLAELAHIRRLRIHTRLPIVLPARVDAELCNWLGSLPWPVAMVVHSNHGNEIDDEVAAALARLRSTGVSLLNQSVLLKGVNDDVATLATLSERLFAAGVLPYYLHLLDRVQGSSHYEVPEARIAELERGLRTCLPGYLMPRWVREVAGEPYKTPYVASL